MSASHLQIDNLSQLVPSVHLWAVLAVLRSLEIATLPLLELWTLPYALCSRAQRWMRLRRRGE